MGGKKANFCLKNRSAQKLRPCPVSERLAKQKFSHWRFPVNSNEAEFFFA